MILVGDGKTQEILHWTLLHLITMTFQLRSVCSTRKLKFKALVSHRNGAVEALEGPKDVTEHLSRFVCDMLETWCYGVCVLKCQNELADVALQNAVVRTRQFKTIPRNAPRYSHFEF